VTLDPAISWILAASFALLFTAASAHKLADWRRFRATVASYRLLPAALAPAAAGVVIVLEAAVVVLLLTPLLRAAGAALAAALLIAYAAAMGMNLARGRTNLDCGCFGAGRRRHVRGWMVGRNLVLAVLASASMLPAGERALVPLDGLTIGGATLVLVLLYIAHGVLGNLPAAATR
jgi:hypothetical protein